MGDLLLKVIAVAFSRLQARSCPSARAGSNAKAESHAQEPEAQGIS